MPRELIYKDEATRAILQTNSTFAYCINNIKPVDAVEVVRCGTCVHFAETKGKDSGKPCGYGKCMKPFFIQMIVDADDFCSYGERREE